MDGCDLNVHLISPARSMPFGSERSHFAHSPHLLASLILLIPPEIGGELKRKGQEQELRAGLLLRQVPGDLPHRSGPHRGPRLPSPSQRAGGGGRSARPERGGPGGFGWFRACRYCWRGRLGPDDPPGVGPNPTAPPGVPWPRVRGPPPTHAPPRRSVALQLISLHAIYHL